jgi:dynein assembly factor with WDR repeat domains 1
MENQEQKFKLFKELRAHLLPLTNCAFNKSGDKFITGSYDRTCKVWDTQTGNELLSLEEHKNVVYTMAFNNPFGNLIVTGSFDKTAKIWDANNGQI